MAAKKAKPHTLHIDNAIKDPGYLHRVTHTPMGQTIPQSKLKAAEHSKNPHERHAAEFAARLEHMNHGKSKKK